MTDAPSPSHDSPPPPGHSWSWSPSGSHSDQIVCECGWTSPSYWDGRDFALSDYVQHLRRAAVPTYHWLGSDALEP